MYSPLMLLSLATFCALGQALVFAKDECTGALGMESGEIKDEQVTATSSHDVFSFGPSNSRLNNVKRGGSWCPQGTVSSSPPYQHLEIDLLSEFRVTAIATQGRHYDNGSYNREFAPFVEIEYWREGMEQYHRYKDRFGKEQIRANNDTKTAVKIELAAPILARKIRIVPWSPEEYVVCMRVELYGCPSPDTVASYSAPVSDRFNSLPLSDETYDGQRNDDILSGGLGQLTDGQIGQYDYRKYPYEWMRWRKSKIAAHLPIRLYLSETRNITALRIHSHNLLRENIQAPKVIRAYFSMDGKRDEGNLVQQAYLDEFNERPRYIHVPIPKRVARVIELELEFGDDWMMLSELTIESTPANGNFTTIPIHHVTLEYPREHIQVVEIHSRQEEYPVEYVGLIIGISLAVFGVVVAAILIVILRHRSQPPYSSVYNSFPKSVSMPDTPKLDIVLCSDGTVSTRQSNSLYRVAPSEEPPSRLMPKSLPPKTHPVSPPPEYISDSSEYAEPDLPATLSTSRQPLLPVKRGDGDYLSRPSTSTSHGIYYASSDIRGAAGTSAYSVQEIGLDSATSSEPLPVIDVNDLVPKEKLGEGEFGEVHLCEYTTRSGTSMVALKLLHANASEAAKRDFAKERHILSRLRHPHIVQLLGASADGSALMVEYMPLGDLNQYLARNNLCYPKLINLASQLASGLAYLESRNFVHRDVATRNCLVGDGLSLKLADFGMARTLYSGDYYRIQGKFVLPIRWMAWESLLLGTFTTKTDVWAFGVTLWEILSHCAQQPFDFLTDEQVIDNIQNMYHSGYLIHYLPKPNLCSSQIYDLMLSCWSRSDSDRPSFATIFNRLRDTEDHELVV